MEGHFRNEIAGLRALAVLSVILFHLKVPGFQGGFVGVDVFFVISGYLISRNILRDLDRGRFSFGQFYTRRARRIFPALVFTVVLTYLLGALWCSPLMFLDIAKECTHALLSIANLQYWREAHQYFAAASDELALLHTWSLSAEEQFYLFWPLFLVFAKKTSRPFTAIAAIALISFAGSIAIAQSDPPAAFFLTPFRIFEFAIGALLLALNKKPTRPAAEVLSGVGVAAIVASAVLFNADMPHQNVAVLLPCLGAAAIIWSGDGPRIARLITNHPMMWIGAISYSLYLCHWPIIFFGRFIFGAVADTAPGIVAMAAVMFVVADLMYRFIERRFIDPLALARTNFLRTSLGLWSVLLGTAALTYITYRSHGFPWRLPQAQTAELRLQSFPGNADIPNLVGPPRVQLVGDSVALQYAYGLTPTFRQLNINYIGLGGAGCPILEGAALRRHVRRSECIKIRDRSLAELAQSDLPIIYTQLWHSYDDARLDSDSDPGRFPENKGSFNGLQRALERTMAMLVARGHRILLVGAQIQPDCVINLPRLLQGPLRHTPLPACPAIPRKEAERMTAPVDRVLASVAAKWPDRVSVLRPMDYFCDSDCPVVANGIWLFNQPIHLSIAGVDRLMRRSEGEFLEFLQNGAVKP
ncbi:MAG: acyltransferase [Bradyrhizobium sp.]|nr:acyltransferase [Bradyrhizobium sp.]